ncbi:exosome complex component RRP43 [Salvelinus sp. IW2-2015]|uniref:exosome complex component RRP43 n=1 Tax=Salvelinus sp. IW2-2015 TaxID=2691554 RepID=UPI0038D4C1CF
MAAGFKTAEPLEYHLRFLKENCRSDGRELGEFRTTTLNIGSISTADGSALVKIGNTTVMCGIKGELANPPVDAPNKGYIVPNVDLPPLCSSRFRPGPPGEQAQAASQFIADVIESSAVIQKEDLCILKGKLLKELKFTGQLLSENSPLLLLSSSPGGTSLSGEKLHDCISRATTRHKEVRKLIDKVIQSAETPK